MKAVVVNKDGVGWWGAPPPRRFHRCKPQTTGSIDGDMINRCACGAIKFEGYWFEKNSRRRDERSRKSA